MKNSKKGFTLVELLVVIAILAILATVAVVGYTSFIKKAELSNDQAAITQMNTGLQAAAIPEGFKNPSDAIDALYSLGWNLGKLETYSSGFHYAYNPDDNKMYLLDEDDNVIYPAEVDKSKLWGMYNDSPNAMIGGVAKYIAVTNITYAKGFEDSFKGNTAYVLDLNGYYIEVGDVECNNVTASNGNIVSGNVTTGEGVTKLQKGTTIEAGKTYENMIFDGLSVANASNSTFINCVFYECSVNFSSNITVKNCRFEGGLEGVTIPCLIYNPKAGNHTVTIENTTFNNVHRAVNFTQNDNTETLNAEIIGCTFNGMDKEYAYIQYSNMTTTIKVENCTFNSLGQGAGIIRVHDSMASEAGYANIYEKITFTNNTISSDISVEEYVDMDGVTTDAAVALDTALTNKMK